MTADNLNNMRVIPDLLAINEKFARTRLLIASLTTNLRLGSA